MIKRIKQIKQVGVFRDFKNGGSLEIKQLTTIFAYNKQGKTTLSSIFESISKNDLTLIIDRKSIPEDQSQTQSIEISYTDSSNLEKKLQFNSSNGWSGHNLKIMVFSNDFVHNNIMSGSEVTRENKERFTDFILGVEGVQLTNAIKNDKKKLRELSENLKRLKPQYVSHITDESQVLKFVNLDIKTSKEQEFKYRESTQSIIKGLEENQSVLRLPQTRILSNNPLFITKTIIKECNNILKRGFSSFTSESLKRFLTHIKKHNFSGEENDWIQRGMKYKNEDSCPFCGQKIKSSEAVALLKTYTDFFSKDFKRYQDEMSASLNEMLRKINMIVVNYSQEIEKEITLANRYIKYIPDINNEIEKLYELVSNTKKFENRVDLVRKNILKQIESSIKKKKKRPHEVLNGIVLTENELEAITQYEKLISSNEKYYNKISKKIYSYRSSVNLKDYQIHQQIQKNKRQLDEINTRIARIEQDKECKKYLDLYEEIQKLKRSIEEKTTRLEDEQSEYLENYFEELNAYYRKLGSPDFELNIKPSNRGDKKVYSLVVKFHGKEIPEDKYSKVFCESDKRGLGLALFFTKLKKLSNSHEWIVVLDDPVVSFDDNRIKSVVHEINQISGNYSQLIILTHYSSLIKEMKRVDTQSSFFKIEKLQDTNIIAHFNVDQFVMTPLQLAFENISQFIDGNFSIKMREQCREYLEEYIKFRLMKKIRESNVITNEKRLGVFLSNLHKAGILNHEQHKQLQIYNKIFSADNHTLPDGGEDPQSIANLARDLLDYLHESL